DDVQLRTVESQGARDLLQRDQRVTDVNERASVAEVGHPGEVVVDERDAGARVERGGTEIVAVARAAQRHEARTVCEQTRVERPAVGRRTGVADDATRGA